MKGKLKLQKFYPFSGTRGRPAVPSFSGVTLSYLIATGVSFVGGKAARF